MPKDYFDVKVEEEEVLSEDEKHAKVIEFVYQVRIPSLFLSHFLDNICFKVTRKSCEAGEYTGWLQDGK